MNKVKIDIFDPPMCCSTGICGPTIDPTLLRINGAIQKLKKDYSDKVDIERHQLGKSLVAFQSNPAILELIKNQGTQVLPVTTVNGKVVKVKGYPTLEELLEQIEK
jgi:hypothetical protein